MSPWLQVTMLRRDYADAVAEARCSRPRLLLARNEIPDFAASTLAPWPFRNLPLAFAPFALALEPGFRLAFSLRSFLALASFSALFFALRSALSFSRSRSARASARFFLRFRSQESHLQPIGFR